ncbi:hypothetical protein LQW54_004407 [Pestalotiopsis sp. IQ-011]
MSPMLDTLYTKRVYLRAMLLGGLLLTACLAKRTVSVVGAPVKRDDEPSGQTSYSVYKRDEATSTTKSTTTRTTTVTVEYKPTLVSGDAKYDLLGCYGHSGLDGSGGHPFGKESDFASPSSVNTTELTAYSCLQGCFVLSPPKGTTDHFKYAGIKNGSPDARKAVASPDAKPTQADSNQPKANAVPPGAATSESDAESKSSGSSGATAAVVGTLSGIFVVVAAIVFFCFRSQRKKKELQNAHVDAMVAKHHDNTVARQTLPLGILATTSDVHDDIQLTIKGDLLPTTPSRLEKGAKPTFPQTPGATGEHPAQERDSLYTTWMSEVIDSPTVPTKGNSSAVQWRTIDHGGGGVPSSPHIAGPPPSTGIHGFGHRRRSTPYGPPPHYPLPPDPPQMLGRGVYSGQGRGGFPPSRPPRDSVATFEAGRDSPTESHSAMSFANSGPEGAKPPVPPKLQRPGVGVGLNVQTSHFGRGGGRSLTGTRAPTPAAAQQQEEAQWRQQPLPALPPVPRPETMNFDSPILPPLHSGERFNFDSRAWKDLPSTPSARAGPRVPMVAPDEKDDRRRRDLNEDGVSPASASTVGSSILGSPSIMDWAAR